MEDQGLTPVVPGIRLLLCAVCSGQSVVSVLDAGSPSSGGCAGCSVERSGFCQKQELGCIFVILSVLEM